MAGPAVASSTRGATTAGPVDGLTCDAPRTGAPEGAARPLLEHPRRTAHPRCTDPRPAGATSLVERAHRVARQLLDPASDRWWHTAGVAGRALQARAAVAPEEQEVLVAAAWLHDIGYAPALRTTGFHPLDGARHLRETGWPEVVVSLVAHHSGARFMAEVKGLGAAVEDFSDPRGWEGPLADALVWADQTTSPLGHLVDVDDRLAEARARHGEGSDLAIAHALRAPAVRAAAAATQRRLDLATPFDLRN